MRLQRGARLRPTVTLVFVVHVIMLADPDSDEVRDVEVVDEVTLHRIPGTRTKGGAPAIHG